MKKITVIILIFLCITVIFSAGCTGSTASDTNTAPKFKPGDIAAKNDTVTVGNLILDYDKSHDNYTIRAILQKTDGSWGYYLSDFISHPINRVSLEANFSFLARHIVDPTIINTIDYNNSPLDVAYFKELGYYQTVSNSTQPLTPTPQFVYASATVTPTPTPIVTLAQDPIIGVWRYYTDTSDARIRFNADGTYVESNYINARMSLVWHGTWSARGGNSYTETSEDGNINTITYDPTQKTITSTDYTNTLFTRYQGDVAAASSSASTPTYSSQSSSSSSTHFSGNGDDVQSFTATGSGLRIFTMRNSGGEIGNRNFAVILKDQNGETISLLANEIGDYSGKKSTVLQSGKYYLDVSSGGSWSIDITSS